MSFSSHLPIVRSSSLTYLDSATAKLVDDKLMCTPGFSIDQLMELAGYSVACAAHEMFTSVKANKDNKHVLVLSGPGNNGGDGIVAARHLKHFGYQPTLVYPKKSRGVLFDNLQQQCRDLEIEVRETSPTVAEMNSAGLIIDAIFGFSFQGPAREPFLSLIDGLKQSSTPILSVDVPSGWNVDEGDVYGTGFNPAGVISLTLPKRCMINYDGLHFVGGRFVPPTLQKDLALQLPDYGFGPAQIAIVENDKKSSASNQKVEEDFEKIVAMYVTASSEAEAMKIADALISKNLAACVNLIPQVRSVYKWEGKVESSQEVLMMIKTQARLAASVTEEVKAQHSYDLPESIVVRIENEGSSADYLRWVHSSTSPADNKA